MKRLIHTLYITESDVTLHLRDEAIEVERNHESLAHIPLHNIESIVSFSYMPASPALLTECASRHIAITVLSQTGKLKYRVVGATHGNPELRLLQYQKFSDDTIALQLAKKNIDAKIENCITVAAKYRKNHAETHETITSIVEKLRSYRDEIPKTDSTFSLRGIEGVATRTYYEAFKTMNIAKDEAFHFNGRSKRPPCDYCNAMMSLAYTLLTHQCMAALEIVGLDPYLGVMHESRSGKPALALDMVEELRPAIADRFVLRLVNLNIVTEDCFDVTEEGITLLPEGMKKYLREWNTMGEREIHTEDGKVPLRLLPYLQAQKLARYLYEKDEEYVPYKIKEV